MATISCEDVPRLDLCSLMHLPEVALAVAISAGLSASSASAVASMSCGASLRSAIPLAAAALREEFVLGGIGDDSRSLLHCADIERGLWEPVLHRSFLDFRMGAARAFLHGKLYTAGGHVLPDSESLTTLMRLSFDPEALEECLAPMPTARSAAAAVAAEQRLYVVGGICNAEWTMLRALEYFSPLTGVWVKCQNMPISIHYCRAAYGVVEGVGVIFVVGQEEQAEEPLAVVESFDTRSGEWSTISSICIARYDPLVFATRGKIYVFGGFADRGPCDHIECLSVVDGLNADAVWENLPPPDGALPCVCSTAVMWTARFPGTVAWRGGIFARRDCVSSDED